MISPLQIHWQLYRDTAYPDGTTGTQNKECHQAFMAGALQMFVLMNAASALPSEAEAFKILDALKTELETYMPHIFTTTHPPDLGGS